MHFDVSIWGAKLSLSDGFMRYMQVATRVHWRPLMLHALLMLQTYMLKLAKSGEDGEKAFLVLESGSRFHTTQVSLLLAGAV